MASISTSNGKWLAPSEIATYTSVTPEVKSQITEYLIRNSIPSKDISFNSMGNQIKVKSDVGKVSKMFSAEFRNYKTDVEGTSLTPRTKEFTVPSEISQHVVSVSPLTVFQEVQHGSKMQKRRFNADKEGTVEKKRGLESCDVSGVTPECLRTLYETIDYKPNNGTETPDVAIMEYIE